MSQSLSESARLFLIVPGPRLTGLAPPESVSEQSSCAHLLRSSCSIALPCIVSLGYGSANDVPMSSASYRASNWMRFFVRILYMMR